MPEVVLPDVDEEVSELVEPEVELSDVVEESELVVPLPESVEFDVVLWVVVEFVLLTGRTIFPA